MSQAVAVESNKLGELSEAKAGTSLSKDAYRRLVRNKVAVVSFWVIMIYVVVALLVLAGVLYPDIHVAHNDMVYQAPSLEHPFGTDIAGRDILGRGVHGIVTALSIGLLASGIALIIGIVMGALAGYFCVLVDAIVTWIYTTLDSVPYILLLPSLTFLLGRTLTVAYIAIGLTSWVTTCRLIRGEFMKHKERDYVAAAYALGANNYRRIFRHILPNVLHLGFVQFGLVFVAAIKLEVILSAIGMGVDPSTPSWGIMLDDAKTELMRPFWWNLNCATVLMFGLILAFNLFNDALREAVDPKLKNR